METVDNSVRSMDIVNTAAIVTTMAQLCLIYHKLAVFLSGMRWLYLAITENILIICLVVSDTFLLVHPLSARGGITNSVAGERYPVTSCYSQVM